MISIYFKPLLMIYIKIKDPDIGLRKDNFIKRAIMFFVQLVLPMANPDFDKKIDLVTCWLLEFTEENSTPEREVGLNKDGDVIMKMPFQRNYGYWVDNTLTLTSFKERFEYVEIEKEYFEEKWNDESKLP